MSTISLTLSLSLFDSLSTTQQIIIFMLLLTTYHPLRSSMAYLAGLSGSYIVCGVAGFLALDRLQAFLSRYVPSTAGMSDALYYRIELITGLVMTLIGIWYFLRKRHAPPDRFQNIFVTRLKSMSPLFAALLGAFISVSSFPVAVPYLLALQRYASLGMGVSAAVGSILLYNFGYALPMIAILIAYLFARKRAEDLADTLHEKTRMLNVHLTTLAWAGLGAFSTVDALCYFLTGHSLVRGRYL